MVYTLAKGCSAVGPTRIEPIWNEPLSMHVSTVVGHVWDPLLALGGVAAVAAVSLLIAEAARGREGHHPILVHGYPSIGVSLVKSSQLFISVRHDVRIAKCVF